MRETMGKKTAALQAPSFDEYLPWTLEKFKNVAGAVNDGDFSPLGNVIAWVCTDGRIGNCNEARYAGLLSDAEIEIEGGSEEEKELLKKDFRRAWKTLPTYEIMTGLRYACTQLVQVKHFPDGLPWFEPWKLQLLQQRNDTWYVTKKEKKTSTIYLANGSTWAQEEEIDITPETGNFALLGTEQMEYPWHSFRAAWNILAPMCIGGLNALVWWLRNAMHTSISPITVNTTGVASEDFSAFWDLMTKIGQLIFLEVPYGMKLERMQSNPIDHISSKELKQELDMCKAEYLLGQSLSTRMDKGGSYAAVTTLVDKISAPRLRLELAFLADCINANWIPRWKIFRQVTSDISLGWLVESLDDKLKKLEIEKAKRGE
jgi:hypothetical protein